MIRLGRISYVNMAPVFYRLGADVEEVAGVPVELNERLLAGGIDIAPISSIEYARNAARLRILPRWCSRRCCCLLRATCRSTSVPTRGC